MRRNVLFLTVMLTVAGFVGFVATARALPCVAGCVFYYSDNTFTVQVGYKCWNCTGGPTHSGIQTQFALVDNPFDSCCGGGGDGGECICSYWYNPITHAENLQCDC